MSIISHVNLFIILRYDDHVFLAPHWILIRKTTNPNRLTSPLFWLSRIATPLVRFALRTAWVMICAFIEPLTQNTNKKGFTLFHLMTLSAACYAQSASISVFASRLYVTKLMAFVAPCNFVGVETQPSRDGPTLN